MTWLIELSVTHVATALSLSSEGSENA
jgi:hypothetical protein